MWIRIRYYIETTPWWLVPVLFAATIAVGVYVGAPIAVAYYGLGIPSEVRQLFALMPFVYFHALLALCLLCVPGLRLVRARTNTLGGIIYVLLCVLAVPAVFYGIGVSGYYG